MPISLAYSVSFRVIELRCTTSLVVISPIDDQIYCPSSIKAITDVSDYKKEYTNIYLHASNSSGAEGLIELPLFYYRGYVVENLTTHQIAQAEAGAIKNVSFKVPVGEYDYKIYYNGINYWYIGYYVSLASVILLVFYTIYIFYNRNIDKNKK